MLESIAVEGTWLEHEDVATLLRLAMPGIDELAALLEISRLAEGRRFDLVVIDTAPTGHTLRMLALPETLAGMARVFDRMREKRRVMEDALRGAWRRGPEDDLIDEIEGMARDLWQLLRDRARTCVSWVTLPEPMAIAETGDAVKALAASGLEVSTIIVNQLTREPRVRCGHCDARRSLERRVVGTLPRVATIAGVHAREIEPRGLGAHSAIAREIASGHMTSIPAGAARAWKASLSGRKIRPERLVPESTRLVLFGGKGGVGKTTCAAAMALAIADRHPTRRVLLLSTDPAHSLADVFGSPLSDAARRLPRGPANLSAREMDAAAFLARIRERYISAVDEMFDRVASGSFDVVHDRAVMNSLIDLTPPGLDEVAAVLETVDALSAGGEWDLVVMDTAPTGHALRLLEMPALIQDWARALMRILLKYQKVTGLGELGVSLLNLSKGVGRLRQLLADGNESAFIVVTRAAALPRLESARLITRLSTLGVHVPAIVVNAVGRGSCDRCRSNSMAEQREVTAMRKGIGWTPNRQVIATAAQIPPPHGVAALRRWSTHAWRATTGYHQDR